MGIVPLSVYKVDSVRREGEGGNENLSTLEAFSESDLARDGRH